MLSAYISIRQGMRKFFIQVVCIVLVFSQNMAWANSWYFGKTAEEVRKEQQSTFLKEALCSLNNPEVWENSVHLAHILVQLEQFADLPNYSQGVIQTLITQRIMALMSRD